MPSVPDSPLIQVHGILVFVVRGSPSNTGYGNRGNFKRSLDTATLASQTAESVDLNCLFKDLLLFVLWFPIRKLAYSRSTHHNS